jgi:transposase
MIRSDGSVLGFRRGLVSYSSCWLDRGQQRMTRALSPDLRDRVVVAVRKGASCREAEGILGERGRCGALVAARAEPGQHGAAAASRKTAAGAAACARLAAYPLGGSPDLTVRALQAELVEVRGVRVGYGAVWRFLAADAR